MDGLIILHLPNIRYLCGFTGTAGIAALLPEETVFFTDFRYRTQAEAEAGDAARVEIVASDMWKRLWEVLGEYPKVETLGFESHVVTVAEAQRFSETGLRLRCQPSRELVERLRVTKDAEEIAAIRAAAALAVTRSNPCWPACASGNASVTSPPDWNTSCGLGGVSGTRFPQSWPPGRAVHSPMRGPAIGK